MKTKAILKNKEVNMSKRPMNKTSFKTNNTYILYPIKTETNTIVPSSINLFLDTIAVQQRTIPVSIKDTLDLVVLDAFQNFEKKFT